MFQIAVAQVLCVVCVEERLADPVIYKALKTCSKNLIDWFVRSDDFQVSIIFLGFLSIL